MKFGETFRQNSDISWRVESIDYDDIKLYIKEHTTAGKPTEISLDGRGDEKPFDFETGLYRILVEQHARIDLTVKVKCIGIREQLKSAKSTFSSLSNRQNVRVGRYVQLDNDVVKLGDQIKSLARFANLQRVAYGKLLKKYKKWTGSTDLEDRVRGKLFDDPKCGTNLDFGALLDDYSDILQDVRRLFEKRVPRPGLRAKPSESSLLAGMSSIEHFNYALANKSKLDFDVAMDTVPLGQGASTANYFVHPENVIELQFFLLQYMQYFMLRSRMSSATRPITPQSLPDFVEVPFGGPKVDSADCFLVAADHPERLAQRQAAITVDEREHAPGVIPQCEKVSIHWNLEENPILATRVGRSRARLLPLKNTKHVDHFFDPVFKYTQRKPNVVNGPELDKLRDELMAESSLEKLYQISTNRSRFLGLNNGSEHFVLGSLDTNISIRHPDGKHSSDFPFAILQIRQEGTPAVDLLSTLDQSHLVERVRGFSLQHHALWEVAESGTMTAPFWQSILSRDIRKLPPPALSLTSRSPSPSESLSIQGITDSTTAVPTANPSSTDMPDSDMTSPVNFYRSKRRRHLEVPGKPPLPQIRYWNEYDHPEDGEDGDAYLIDINPDEDSIFDRFFNKIGVCFGVLAPDDEESARKLKDCEGDRSSSSSDDETTPLNRQRMNYGATGINNSPPLAAQDRWSRIRSHSASLPTAGIAVSMALLLLATFLAFASRSNSTGLARERVDVAVIFTIVAALSSALVAVAALHRNPHVDLPLWSSACAILVTDAIWSGFLVAWMLG